MKTDLHTINARKRHHAALATLAGLPESQGIKIWRKLRRIETLAHAAATAQCNGAAYAGQPFRQETEWEAFSDSIRTRVASVFGGTLPEGFRYNTDPRGYALKLEAAQVPPGLDTDWGGYGILAAEIN